MNINCPLCNQLLDITGVPGPHVQCPHCAGTIDISACAGAAAPPMAPLAAPVAEQALAEEDPFEEAEVGVHTRLRRQSKQRTWQAAALVGALLVMVGLGVGVAVVTVRMAPERREASLPLPLVKAHELIAEQVPIPRNAQFADKNYRVKKVAGSDNEWSVQSFFDFRQRDGKLVRQRISAVVRREGQDAWQLQRLAIGGQSVALKGEFDPFKELPKSEFPIPKVEEYVEPEDRTPGKAVRNLADAIDAAAKLRQTLVVWLFDVSPSAEKWRNEVAGNFSPVYDALRRHGQAKGDEPAHLQMAVVAFDHESKFVIEQPTSDTDEVRTALEELDRLELGANRGRERPFAALQTAVQKFGDFRGGYLQFVIVTEEAGEDEHATIDAVIPAVRRLGARVYVIGKEAPFGRTAWPEQSSFGSRKDDPLRQGPESLYPQRINLQFWQAGFADKNFELPAGFGPYALSRLCRQTGGTFFLCDSGGFSMTFSPGWGGGGESVVFDPKVRTRYTPRYRSAQEYEAFVQSNAAARALDAAAKLPFVELAANLRFQFSAPNEAQLNRELGNAQKSVARLTPKLEMLYNVLTPGAKDREKLTEPRWQAAFDLAMGRVLAAKSRVEGYNAMLAALKAGRNFKNPDSTTWVIKASDEIESGSKYERLIRDAKKYLQRILKDHPGTPWAHLAKRELSAKLGWEWDER